MIETRGAEAVALPREVLKRDGRRLPFDAGKIRSAIARAGRASGEFGEDEAALLTAQVTKVLIHRFCHHLHGQAPAIEQIQDVVEQTLIAANHLRTARAYIVYREQHAKLRQDRKTLVDVESSINEYLNRQDWRVNANANQGYSLGGLILNVAGKVTANYWLSHVYAPEAGAAHREGDIHIHQRLLVRAQRCMALAVGHIGACGLQVVGGDQGLLDHVLDLLNAGCLATEAMDQHLGRLGGEQLRLIKAKLARGAAGTRDGRGNAAGVERGRLAAALDDVARQRGDGGWGGHVSPLNTTYSVYGDNKALYVV